MFPPWPSWSQLKNKTKVFFCYNHGHVTDFVRSIQAFAVELSWRPIERGVSRVMDSMSDEEIRTFLETGLVYDTRFELVRISPDIGEKLGEKVKDLFNPSGSVNEAAFLIFRRSLPSRGFDYDKDVKMASRSDLPLL